MQCLSPVTLYAQAVPGGPVVAFASWVSSANTTCASGEFAIVSQTEFDMTLGRAINPDVISAEMVLFGVVLAAACIVWAAKQVFSTLYGHRAET